MGAVFSFTCSCCGELCEGSPSFGFKRPDHWLDQSDEVRAVGFANNDKCWYQDEDGMHYFIRTILQIPIIGIGEPFLWGVWVSLSKVSFDRYIATYDAPELGDKWFGYLCSALPGYASTYDLETTVRPAAGKGRPVVSLHKSDHQLFVDFSEGISVERAQALAEPLLGH